MSRVPPSCDTEESFSYVRCNTVQTNPPVLKPPQLTQSLTQSRGTPHAAQRRQTAGVGYGREALRPRGATGERRYGREMGRGLEALRHRRRRPLGRRLSCARSRRPSALPRLIHFEANHLVGSDEVDALLKALEQRGYQVRCRSMSNIIVER